MQETSTIPENRHEAFNGIIHLALRRDLVAFAERNILGTLRLMEAARAAGVRRFILISTCAVHEKILDDRPLDETHPLWPASHYGAHKAALEAFVHSYGIGQGWEVCAFRVHVPALHRFHDARRHGG